MARPIRVMHVLNSCAGGATNCALDIIRGLPFDQYQMFLVVPSAPNEEQRRALASVGAEWQIVPIGWWNRKIRLSWPRRIASSLNQNVQTIGNLRTVYRIAACIRSWRIDVVHTHTGLVPWGAIAARVVGVPHVWHLHEPNGTGKPFQYWIPDSLLRRVIERMSDHIILVSEYVGDLFRNRVTRTPMTVAYQGVESEDFRASDSGKKLRRSLAIEDNEFVIGMVGSVTSTLKRHDLFIKIAERLSRRLPHARFAVFGQVPVEPSSWLYNSAYEYARRIKRIVEEDRLSDRFIWAGFHSDIPAIMNAIDILVHLSDVEGFGRVAVEAMAAGRPVVAPNRGGIAESVVDGVTGFLVEANDVEAFAEACERLIANPDLRRRMGEAGRTHARSHFSTQEHFRKVTRIYDDVVRRSGTIR